jgi:hypothetical protein
MVQPERRHNRHDVDVAEETRERYKQTCSPEQVVVVLDKPRSGTTKRRHRLQPSLSHIYLYFKCIIQF